MSILFEERMSVQEQPTADQEPDLRGLPCRVVLDVLHDRVCRQTGWVKLDGAYRTVLCPEHLKELEAKIASRPYYPGQLIWDISCPGEDVDATSCPHGDVETSDPYTPGGCWGWYLTGRKSG